MQVNKRRHRFLLLAHSTTSLHTSSVILARTCTHSFGTFANTSANTSTFTNIHVSCTSMHTQQQHLPCLPSLSRFVSTFTSLKFTQFLLNCTYALPHQKARNFFHNLSLLSSAAPTAFAPLFFECVVWRFWSTFTGRSASTKRCTLQSFSTLSQTHKHNQTFAHTQSHLTFCTSIVAQYTYKSTTLTMHKHNCTLCHHPKTPKHKMSSSQHLHLKPA